MKLSKNPALSGLLFGLIVFVVVFVSFLAFGFYVTYTAVCPSRPGDPCDGPAMVFVSAMYVGFFGGLLLGAITAIVAGITTAIKNQQTNK